MKNPIPAPNSYFFATSHVDGDKDKPCLDLYRITKDHLGLLVHPLCHLRESYQRGNSVFPFEVDIDWFKRHSIQIIDENAAKAVMAKEALFDEFLKKHDDQFSYCNLYKFDVDAKGHDAIPLSHGDEVLRIAKLNSQGFLRLAPKVFKHVTHISDRGDLITNIKGEMKKVSYKDVELQYLERFLASVEEIGFKKELEPFLISSDRRVLLREPPKQDGLALC